MRPEDLADADVKRGEDVVGASHLDVADPRGIDRDAGGDHRRRVLAAGPQAGGPETVPGCRVESGQPPRLEGRARLGADADQEQAPVEDGAAQDRRLVARRSPIPDPEAGHQLEGVEMAVAGTGEDLALRDQRLALEGSEAGHRPHLVPPGRGESREGAASGAGHDVAAGDDRAALDGRPQVRLPGESQLRRAGGGERRSGRVAVAGEVAPEDAPGGRRRAWRAGGGGSSGRREAAGGPEGGRHEQRREPRHRMMTLARICFSRLESAAGSR